MLLGLKPLFALRTGMPDEALESQQKSSTSFQIAWWGGAATKANTTRKNLLGILRYLLSLGQNTKWNNEKTPSSGKSENPPNVQGTGLLRRDSGARAHLRYVGRVPMRTSDTIYGNATPNYHLPRWCLTHRRARLTWDAVACGSWTA